jgi:hypothetical protein
MVRAMIMAYAANEISISVVRVFETALDPIVYGTPIFDVACRKDAWRFSARPTMTIAAH